VRIDHTEPVAGAKVGSDGALEDMANPKPREKEPARWYGSD